MSDEAERELVQLRAQLASALGVRVGSNDTMLAATRRLRDEHEKWAAAIAETAVRLSDAGYHGQSVDSVTRLIADRAELAARVDELQVERDDLDQELDAERISKPALAMMQNADLRQLCTALWDLCKKTTRIAMAARCKGCHDDGKELAALRASAVVLPEHAYGHIANALADSPHLSDMEVLAALGVITKLLDSWRPATVEAAPTAGIAFADELWPPVTQPDRGALTAVLASAICRRSDPNMDDGLTPTMTGAEAAYYVDALLARYDIRERGETA